MKMLQAISRGIWMVAEVVGVALVFVNTLAAIPFLLAGEWRIAGILGLFVALGAAIFFAEGKLPEEWTGLLARERDAEEEARERAWRNRYHH